MTRSSAVAPVILAAVAVVMGATTAVALPSAMVHPNLQRGDGDVVERFAFDQVNLFNGNLRIDLPIGQSFPLSSRFSYRLVLSYNSNAWDFTQNADGTVAAQPMTLSNAGLGWDLSLGRLVPPGAPGNTLQRWIYVAADGTASPFYDRLHHDEPASSVAADVFYSRDGTYMRLRRIDAGNVRVEMADGRVTSFVFHAAENAWRLAWVADKYGSSLAVTYGTGVWTLTDSHGRVHRIYFAADSAGLYGGLVNRVELAAFAGATATYAFSYSTLPASRPGDNDPATPATLDVPVLESLVLPDGTSYAFSYPGTNRRLGTMRLPTLGQVEWTYVSHPFVASGCAGPLPAVLRTNPGGLLARTTRAADGQIEGTWQLSSWLNGAAPSPSCSPYRVVRIQTPLDDDHRYHFTVDTVGAQSGNYGLPSRADNAYASGQALSEIVYDCQPGWTGCVGVRNTYRRFEQDAAATPAAYDGTQRNRREAALRTVFADDPYPGGGLYYADVDRFDFDGLGHYRRIETRGNFGTADYVQRVVDYDAATGSYPGSGWSKPAPAAAWVLGTFRSTRISNGSTTEVVDHCFDKATGHELRRRLRLSSTAPTTADAITSFARDGAGNIVDERHFGGDVQSVGTQTDLCAVALPATAQYRLQHTHQYGMLASSRFLDAAGASFGPPFLDRTIDRNTGLTAQERNSAGIRTDITYDARGRTTWIKPQAGHGAWENRVYYAATGTGGSSARTEVLHYPNGGASALLARQMTHLDGLGRVDLHREWMPGGIEARTDYRFDAMGHLSQQSEPHAGAEPVKWTTYLEHDPFGRARRVRPPSGAADDVVHQYLGIRASRRTGQMAVYHNNGNVVREGQTSEQVYDRQGRLWKSIVRGSAIAGSPDLVTERFYDVAGRLTKTMRGTTRVGDELLYDGRGFVDRRYSDRDWYDIRLHDALGSSREYWRWRGTTYYALQQTLDAAGRVTEVRSPHYAPYLLKEFVYAASNAAGDWRAGKLYMTKYHHDFARAQSFGLNYPYWGVNKATVTETFTYGGPGGRISRLSLGMQSSRHWESTSTTFAYDELANVTQIGYPDGNVDDSRYLDRRRIVDNRYEYGRLTAITGHYARGTAPLAPETWAAVSYHGDGMPRDIAHGNGVTYTTTLDSQGRYRYGSLRTTGAMKYNPGLGGGDYPLDLVLSGLAYDGEGSLIAIAGELLLPDSPPQYAPPPSSPPPSGSGGCSGEDTLVGYVDPLGAKIVYSDGSCDPQAFAMYTASGRLYRFEDYRGGQNNFRWTFTDHDGRVLTEITSFRGGEPQERDFIYLGERTLGTFDRRHDSDRSWHYHSGVGGRGAVTNENRYRVDLDPDSW